MRSGLNSIDILAIVIGFFMCLNALDRIEARSKDIQAELRSIRIQLERKAP